MLVLVLISQPSVGTLLQSAKAPLQLPTAHAPAWHAAVAFGSEHALPHPPQWLTLVLVFTSQPSEATRLQSALGAAQPES